MAISHGRGTPGNGHGRGNGNGYSNGHKNGNGNGNGNGDGAGHGATAKEQLYEILHVAFKRWRMIVALFAAVSIPGALMTCTSKTRYAARGKVLISSDRADVTIQPSEINSLAEIKLNEAVVNSEVHIIRSRELMEQVARGLRVARTSGGVVGIANADNGGGDLPLGEKAHQMGRRLRVTPVRNSNVIEVAFTSGVPTEATQIVNRVIDEYLTYHALVHSQAGLSDFYQEQSRGLLQDLRRSEETLRDYSYREGLVAPVPEIQAAVTSVSQVESSMVQQNGNIAGMEEQIRVIRQQISEQPSVVKRTQYLEVNPVVRQLKQHMVSRQVDQISLLRKYTDKDRHVRDNAEEIDELRGQLDEAARDEPTVVTQEVFGTNPVYEMRLNQLLALEASLKESRARRLSLEEELARGKRRLIQLKQKALEFDHLEQEVKRNQSRLTLYEKRAQEARIGDAMDQQKLVNVQVVERPGLPLEPIGNKWNSLVLALISGLVVSLGGAFGLEYVNRTLRFERDVERHLGLPVLGTIAEAKRS